MFAYGMAIGVEMKVLKDKTFLPVVEKAREGLRKHATKQDGKYLVPTRVCEGTCIGDRAYYFIRKTKEGVNYAIGAYIMLELEYEKLKIKIVNSLKHILPKQKDDKNEKTQHKYQKVITLR